MSKHAAFFLVVLITIFTTAPLWAEAPDFRFGVITDVQYVDQESYDSTQYRLSPQKLQDAVRELNQRDLTFTVHLGDFIDYDFESFHPLLEIWGKLNMKSYHVLGNHDYDVIDSKKPEVPKILGLETNYYDFQVGNWHFFVLDGNEIGFHAHRKGSGEYAQAQEVYKKLRDVNAPNASPLSGAVSADQLNWLDQGLADACSANQKAVILSHFPVYPKHKTNLWNDEAVLSVLEQHGCVLAHMNGHNHQGGYGVNNGIHYVTFHAMVETADTNAYAVVNVYEDRLEIEGFGREISRILT